jgi:hypothetical protein
MHMRNLPQMFFFKRKDFAVDEIYEVSAEDFDLDIQISESKDEEVSWGTTTFVDCD